MGTPPSTAPTPPAGHITLLTATALVVADMIGTAVFTSLGFQVGSLPSGFALLMLWAVGGLCALCGALTYGELAASLPRSGGEYHFLSRIYHPALGFMAGWISITVGFAAPVALAATAFAKYAQSALPPAWGGGLGPFLAPALVLAVTAVHLAGSRQGSRFQNGATLLKVALLVGLILAGLFLASPQPLPFRPVAGDHALIFSSAFAGNLFWVMYAYSGWNASIYIVNEVRRPQRNVPLSVVLGTLLVTALYVLLNFTMLRAAPLEKLRGAFEVTEVAAHSLFGDFGARLVAALIALGLVATVSAMIFIGPRVATTMGEDWPALSFLARTRQGVPVAAILLQTAITGFLLFTFSFETVNRFVAFALSLCAFLTVAGLYVLRWRQPELPRPVRAWGYPFTPALFLAVTAWMLWVMLRDSPGASLGSLGICVSGLLLYAAFARRAGRRGPEARR